MQAESCRVHRAAAHITAAGIGMRRRLMVVLIVHALITPLVLREKVTPGARLD